MSGVIFYCGLFDSAYRLSIYPQYYELASGQCASEDSARGDYLIGRRRRALYLPWGGG
jgi:hypothetical protein